MNVQEWRKRYSPKNEIIEMKEIAEKLGLAPSTFFYKLQNGWEMANQEEPKLIQKGGRKNA